MSGAGSVYNELISRQLQKATSDLRSLQQLLLLEGIDPRVLLDFREAVDNVRHTAWAVQESLELKTKKEDLCPVLSFLTDNRIRVATQLTTDLAIGFDKGEINPEAKGVASLGLALEQLAGAMARSTKG